MSQNGLVLPHIVNCSGWSSGNARFAKNASTTETRRKPIAPATMRSTARPSGVLIRSNKSFRQAHRFGIGERLVQIGQRVDARADRAPRRHVAIALEHAQRAHEVTDLAAPASANLEMLAV